MYKRTPVLKTSGRLLLWNIVRYTFPKTAVYEITYSYVYFQISNLVIKWQGNFLPFIGFCQCCGFGWKQIDIRKSSTKSWEIHIKIHQNYKNIIFKKKKNHYFLIHINNKVIKKNYTFSCLVLMEKITKKVGYFSNFKSDRDPLLHETDSRIQIKIKRTHNTRFLQLTL